MSQDGDNEPAGKAEGAKEANTKATHLQVVVKDQQGNEVFFKIRFTTDLEKVMSSYADREGRHRDSLRFLVDGHRIQKGETPKDLEMEDGDSIDVFTEQLGGGQINDHGRVC